MPENYTGRNTDLHYSRRFEALNTAAETEHNSGMPAERVCIAAEAADMRGVADIEAADIAAPVAAHIPAEHIAESAEAEQVAEQSAAAAEAEQVAEQSAVAAEAELVAEQSAVAAETAAAAEFRSLCRISSCLRLCRNSDKSFPFPPFKI